MDNIELKVLKFKKGVTTAGDTWNDSAYDTIETPSELTYEFDGCESCCSEIGATKDDLIAKAIKAESWNTWFYEMEGEYKTFQEVGLESPMVFVPEEDCEITVDGIGDFINNGKGYCPKSFYNEVKEQLLEIALNAVEITVIDKNGEDITSQFSSNKVYLVNAFTPNMLNSETLIEGFNVSFDSVSKEEAMSLMTDSAIGHEDFAEALNVPYNRISLKLRKGDTFVLAQRIGERLPEGTTTLNGDIQVVFLKGVIK